MSLFFSHEPARTRTIFNAVQGISVNYQQASRCSVLSFFCAFHFLQYRGFSIHTALPKHLPSSAVFYELCIPYSSDHRDKRSYIPLPLRQDEAEKITCGSLSRYISSWFMQKRTDPPGQIQPYRDRMLQRTCFYSLLSFFGPVFLSERQEIIAEALIHKRSSFPVQSKSQDVFPVIVFIPAFFPVTVFIILHFHFQSG